MSDTHAPTVSDDVKAPSLLNLSRWQSVVAVTEPVTGHYCCFVLAASCLLLCDHTSPAAGVLSCGFCIHRKHMTRMTRARFCLAGFALALAITSTSAQIVRSDNSPVCNTYLPQCEAKCKRGEAYIFVCSAGNGPQGGPYIICRCAAPFIPNPPAQGE